MRQPIQCSVACFALLLCSSPLFGQDGATLYRTSCASCHDAGVERAPNNEALRAMSPERVLAAMETGPMISMASRQTAAERRAIAQYVTGKSFGQALQIAPTPQAMCPGAPGSVANPLAGPRWAGWGANSSNTRFQDAGAAGLARAQIPRLKLKWAFGFAGDQSENSQPTIYGGRVFVGSQGGIVYSLSASAGCVHWWFDTGRSVRSSIIIAAVKIGVETRYVAFFGDSSAYFYAVEAATGKLLWKTKVDSHPAAPSRALPRSTEGGFMSRCPPGKKLPAPRPTTNAVDSAAA